MTCQPVHTSKEVDYRLLEDFDVSLEWTDYLLFEIKSDGDMPLLLMHDKTDFHSQLYEIVIGEYPDNHFVIIKSIHTVCVVVPFNFDERIQQQQKGRFLGRL